MSPTGSHIPGTAARVEGDKDLAENAVCGTEQQLLWSGKSHRASLGVSEQDRVRGQWPGEQGGMSKS